MFNKKRINLDYASGGDNPSAIYAEGVEIKNSLENARVKTARVLGVQKTDIVFTSGGTESNSLALLGIFEKAKEKISKPHFIISSLEHSAIIECTKEIVRRGGEVTIINNEENGLVNVEDVYKTIKPSTVLVSIVHANNETGSIQPIHKISRVINEYKKRNNSKLPYFHTDASQSGCYLSLQISSLGVDLMTIDASKVNGPKGTGLLVVRSNVEILPIIFGGGQEHGLRSGTENVSAIIEFSEALFTAQKNKDNEYKKLKNLKDYFIEKVSKGIPKAIINTKPEETLPNIVSVTFPGILAEFMAIKLDKNGVMASVGSACDSNKREIEKEAIRFSFGKHTTKKELDKTISILKEIC